MVSNVCFSEIFTYKINGWLLKKQLCDAKMDTVPVNKCQFKVIKTEN